MRLFRKQKNVSKDWKNGEPLKKSWISRLLVYFCIHHFCNLKKTRIVAYDNKNYGDSARNSESIFSKRVKAGKRRTYFFDVKATRGNDYFITITESKKRFEDDGYDRHKMFIYKEDFNKFAEALVETVNYVKTDLMPDFDFDSFNHADDQENYEGAKVQEEPAAVSVAEPEAAIPVAAEAAGDNSEMDAWKI
ncbi:MAG: DUF3276 family protein [Chitinophagaceae bacterium]